MSKANAFRALRVYKEEHGSRAAVEERSLESLPPGDLLLRVRYSSLNYKDALSATGQPGVTKQYPHTPGIDAFGEAIEGPYPSGTKLIITGFDLGMNTSGGFAEYVRVPSDWAVPLPEGLSLREAASLGTAGLTAGLCVKALLDGGLSPSGDPLLVTGATGGVGVIALGVLRRLGFTLQAVSGKKNAGDLLRPLAGDVEVLPRGTVLENPKRPLLSGRWQGAVDTVGGETLAGLLRSVKQRGTVAACGNAGGGVLSTTVYPFILRGLRLQGIDSAETPIQVKEDIWRRLAGPWKPRGLEKVVHEVDLDAVPREVEAMLAGRHSGRTVIALPGEQ